VDLATLREGQKKSDSGMCSYKNQECLSIWKFHRI